MTPNLLCRLILRQLCTYEILNRIVNSNNNLCIVCFLGIYQNNITLISIPRYYRSSTNISPHLFTLKKIFHHITSIRIILSIQPHTHRLKRIISLVAIINKQRKPECKRKTKYQIAKTKEISSQSWICESCVWD